MLLWEGVFILSYAKYLLSAYYTRRHGGYRDESAVDSALGCVNSHTVLIVGVRGKANDY